MIRRKKIEEEFVIQKISSGCDVFDLALGGGFPIGKIVNIVGDRSSGKSLLCMEFIAKARKIYGDKLKWFYDDVEAGFSFDCKKMYGFDIISSKRKEKDSDTIEEFEYNFEKQISNIEKDEILIYVLDSFDSLSSKAAKERFKKKMKKMEEDDNKKEKGSYKLEKTTEFGEFFRLKKQNIRDKNCILVVVSQVRENIGVVFGKKYYRTGGKALDHYASQIIWLSETEKQEQTIKGRKYKTGITIKAMIEKNKVGKPFRECFINILFDYPYGVDNVSSNIDYLYNLKTELGKLKDGYKKKKIEWNGKEFTREDLIYHIEENNLEETLKNGVIKDWQEIEESLSNNKRKRKYG